MKVIILAGGSGTRLWPLSRKNYPKQFLKLNRNSSLLQQTVERLLRFVSVEDMIIITNKEYEFHVLSDLKVLTLPKSSKFNLILEPISRNTAPAIAIGIKYCIERLGCSEDEVVFVCPSDHIVRPVERFVEYLRNVEEIAKEGYIVTFGIKPDRPETGYGYIKTGDRLKILCNGIECYKVERFTEKPDKETANKYIDQGDYYWNSGMFAFSIGVMMEEFKRYTPEISELLSLNFDSVLAKFVKMPDISIDYAIMEKSSRVVTLPMDIYWNDIGSWDSLCDLFDKDAFGNIKIGDTLTLNTKNTLIISNKRLISTIGLEDCIVVETDDVIMIARRGEAQKVKDIVNMLKQRSRKEVEEHVTVYRPWGSYTVLEDGPRYKVKRIVVNPQEKLSLQMHYHRSEHWVVIKGIAKVTIGDKEIFIRENESAFVPKLTPHRLENPGKVPLEIIEVQVGEYVGEDDIIRYDDIYGRKG
ncbi:mannose-1-phosphate guanylyltransferase/mannose-6-phosphate isomerase [Thermodesulfobacterium commune]|jgi:mannose-1-phosphate guanylyltransferase/mannose-6-phosphate isomerase|uniref:mannose-1-phosphate guanylyltransferase n=2 Tax=Thermodesulfobacterium commune TaxID=1741 RepID=A0A075WV78_9BACT|nr:mannose-1-phosphate guanylyltransferase/mannose-6-phosphate isomerase [Thermodesulfobacterium commune]AIH04363.1 mannose-1-phosphate guanyltransferase [Thermodesulfobacterium commune DSM 2178]MDK2861792.1 mannose-phosphate guanylyltransferase / mannose-6-phosphate isomerase [Thermodesulfobacterium sp.]HAA84210.1 mannose-1-phosphate guanylyltransferase/mannose-6-phosphate isomerase [Thermodesulfobacterium commune]